MGKSITTTIVLTKDAAQKIANMYTVKPGTFARRVADMKPFIGAGHSAISVVTSIASAGVIIPTGLSDKTIGHALGVARAMAEAKELAKMTASARNGIAEALLAIAQRNAQHGGGAAGVKAELKAAISIDGNPAAVAEILTERAEAIALIASNARKINTKTTRGTKGPKAPEAPADNEDNEDTTSTRKTVVAPLSGFSVTRLVSEINARVLGGHVLSDSERALFEQLAVNIENADVMEDVDA